MPYLRQKFQSQGIIHSRILHLKGLTESMTAEKLDDIIMAQTNPTVALYARRGEILVRITAKAASLEDCMALIHNEETKIRAKVGEYIYGTDYETLGEALGKLLRAKGMTIAFAESCTGRACLKSGDRCTGKFGIPHWFRCFLYQSGQT